MPAHIEMDSRSGGEEAEEAQRHKPGKRLASLEANLRGLLNRSSNQPSARRPLRRNRRQRVDAAVAAEKRLKALLLEAEGVFEGTGSVVLTTRTGAAVMWSRLLEASQVWDGKVPPYEEDYLIPEEQRKQDDEVTAGDPEFGELLVAITAVCRLSRKFVPNTFYSRERRRAVAMQRPHISKSPVFRVFGDAVVFSCYALGPYHLLAFYSDFTSFQGEQERAAEAKMKTILDSINALLYPDSDTKDPWAARPPPDLDFI